MASSRPAIGLEPTSGLCGAEDGAKLELLGPSPSVKQSLARSLRRCLWRFLEPSISMDFGSYVAAQTWLDRPEQGLRSATTRYVEYMCNSGWDRYFDRWPAMAEHIALLSSRWSRTSSTAMERFRQDAKDLASFLGCEREDLAVQSVDSDLSDPHDGGQTVVRFQLSNGMCVAYKPRSVAEELAARHALKLMQNERCFRDVEVPSALDCGLYGYLKWINPAQLKSRKEAQAYYRVAGHTFAFLYAIEASDCHHENVIASSRGPVVVDFETLGTSRIGAQAIRKIFGISFINADPTGFLPTRGPSRDIGGLSGVSRSMRFSRRHPNIPRIGRQYQYLSSYKDEFEKGFVEARRQISTLRSKSNIELGLTNAPRVVLRPTSTYYSIFRARLSDPRLSKRPGNFGFRSYLGGAKVNTLKRKIVEAEAECLEAFEIPRFVVFDGKICLRGRALCELPELLPDRRRLNLVDRQLPHSTAQSSGH